MFPVKYINAKSPFCCFYHISITHLWNSRLALVSTIYCQYSSYSFRSTFSHFLNPGLGSFLNYPNRMDISTVLKTGLETLKSLQKSHQKYLTNLKVSLCEEKTGNLFFTYKNTRRNQNTTAIVNECYGLNSVPPKFIC